MIRRILQILLPVVAIALACLGALWLLHNRKVVAQAPIEKFRPRVVVARATLREYQPVVRSQGVVLPRSETGLTPEVSGRVTWTSERLVVGGHFNQAEPLVRLDDTDYRLAMATSRAAMTNAIAQLAQAQARFELESAESAAARAEWKLLGRAGEPPALALRLPQIKEAQAGAEAARANYESAQASLMLASNHVARCVLMAPFDGRVAQQHVVAGQFAALGSVLARLQPVDSAEVRLPLALGDFAHLGISNAFAGGTNLVDGPALTLKATHRGATEEWIGQILRVEGEVNPGTRMMSVVVSLADPYRREKGAVGAVASFGTFVRAEIRATPLAFVAVLPASVLREGRAGPEVYLLSSERKLHARPVKVAWRTRHEVVISEGVQAGEEVCLSELETFEEGMEVILVTAPEPESSP